MRGFAHRHTVDAALAWLDAQLRPLAPKPCRCAQPQAGCWPAPSSATSTCLDSIARRWTGMRSSLTAPRVRRRTPVPLTVIGDAMPGRRSMARSPPGQAVRIMTGRTDAGRHRCRAACRMGRRGSAGSPAPIVSALSPPSRRASTSAGAAKTSSAAATLLRGGPGAAAAGSGRAQLDRRGTDAGIRPATRAAGDHRQRTAARRLASARLSDRRCQRPDARGAGRARRRHRRLPRPGAATMRTRFASALQADADVVIVSGGSSVGIEDLAPALVADTRRAGRYTASRCDRAARPGSA